MKGRKIFKRLISTLMIFLMVLTIIPNTSNKQVSAAVNSKELASTYLNTTTKYLHLGVKENNTYDFNIKKAVQKKGSTYSWYVKKDKGNPDSITINKNTGVVTAKEAGTAYIRCKVTLADGTILRPEANIIVRNNITGVKINNLPKNLTIIAGKSSDFNRTVTNTEAGKGKKTEALTRWEIKDDTAGIEYADENGVVFPTKEGKFKIRAVSFQSLDKYKLWLKDKESNNDYITAASEWSIVTVESSKGIAIVNNQNQLNKALTAEDFSEITLSTKKTDTFIINEGSYSSKSLIVDAPNADVENHGTFKDVTIKAVKDTTWIEYADGNIVYLLDTQLTFVIDSGADIKQIVIDTPNSVVNFDIQGKVDKITVLQPSQVNLTGNTKNIPVSVEESAKGSRITTSIPLDLTLKANTEIVLDKGAEDTILDKSTGTVDVKVDNKSEKSVVITTNKTDGETIKAGESRSFNENTAPTPTPTTIPSGGDTHTPPVETIRVTGISTAPSTMILVIGEVGKQITASVIPANASDKRVIWSTSNAAVATVLNGLVTPVTAGLATITVTTTDGSKTSSCNVTVEAATVTVSGIDITPTNMTLYIGGATGTLTASVKPVNASNKNVTWSSSDDSIATVTNGIVTAVGAGEVTVTATTADGGFKGTANVTVFNMPGEFGKNTVTTKAHNTVDGYIVDVRLTDGATFENAKAVISLYDKDGNILQSNILPDGHGWKATSLTVPFDVKGTYDYANPTWSDKIKWEVDGSVHGVHTIPAKVVIKVTLANGKVITDELSGITPVEWEEEIPETGTYITISNPGAIWAGTEVQLEADLDHITWDTYSFIDDTNGYASIDYSTGVLQAHESGTVRVVARSELNPEVYGAVDITVQAKRFVGYEPLEDVIIDSDLHLVDENVLNASDNILPTKVNLIYETGNGNETETIAANVSSWYGGYSGNRLGKYMLKGYVVDVPTGYDRPDNFEVNICVSLNTLQTDNRIEVIARTIVMKPVIITEDENLVDFWSLFDRYLRDTKIILECSDGTEVVTKVESYFNDRINDYNGDGPKTYNVELIAPIPTSHIHNEVVLGANNVYWYTSDYVSVLVTIELRKAQTPYDTTDLPDTTQQKFPVEVAPVIVSSVNLTEVPSQFEAGEMIDFNKYLSVVTDSDLPADNSVVWSISGNNRIDPVLGRGIFEPNQTIVITATSIIDSTMKSSVHVDVVCNKFIKSTLNFDPILVEEDLEINTFKDLYLKLGDRLPRVITGVNNLDDQIEMQIVGWYLDSRQNNFMILIPNIQIPVGYYNVTMPELRVEFTTPQSDNRAKVISYKLVDNNIPSLSEDKHLVTEGDLYDEIFGEAINAKIIVEAILEDNSVTRLECSIAYWGLRPSGYFGKKGTVTYRLELDYPEGYTSLIDNDHNYDLVVEIPITIEVDQTPEYEEVWVTKTPKLSYKIGDTLELTGLEVRLREFNHDGTFEDVFIGYDEFDEYNIELRCNYWQGERITSGTVLTEEFNESFYLYVINTNNSSFGCFGPVNIAQEIKVITLFEEMTISAGSTDNQYYANTEELIENLPRGIRSRDYAAWVPVIDWKDTDGFSYTKPDTYTFTAVLGDLPQGFTLGDGVAATIEVTVAEYLKIESVYPIVDLVVPVGTLAGDLDLQPYVIVDVSDGNRNKFWVNWDKSDFDGNVEGSYTIIGDLAIGNYRNPNDLKAMINVKVDFDEKSTLQGIGINKLPTKLIYTVGEELDTTGLSYLKYYSDGSVIQAVSGAAIISAFDSSTVGIKDVTLTCNTASDTFNVYVKDPDPTSIAVLYVIEPNNIEVTAVTGSAITISLPDEPIKPGYSFAGWFTGENGSGMKVTNGDIANNDMVVFTNWDKHSLYRNGSSELINHNLYECYEFYVGGTYTPLMENVTFPNAYSKNNNFWFDVDSPSGTYQYNISDVHGRLHTLIFQWIEPSTKVAVSTGEVDTINGDEYIKYLVQLDEYSWADYGVYSLDCESYHYLDDQMRMVIHFPCSITVPGDYRMLIHVDNHWYKTVIHVD